MNQEGFLFFGRVLAWLVVVLFPLWLLVAVTAVDRHNAGHPPGVIRGRAYVKPWLSGLTLCGTLVAVLFLQGTCNV